VLVELTARITHRPPQIFGNLASQEVDRRRAAEVLGQRAEDYMTGNILSNGERVLAGPALPVVATAVVPGVRAGHDGHRRTATTAHEDAGQRVARALTGRSAAIYYDKVARLGGRNLRFSLAFPAKQKPDYEADVGYMANSFRVLGAPTPKPPKGLCRHSGDCSPSYHCTPGGFCIIDY
jgi:hypothetical protein